MDRSDSDQFDDIRPHSNEEFPQVVRRLVKSRFLTNSIRELVWPGCPGPLKGAAEFLIRRKVGSRMRRVRTIEEFQQRIVVGQLLEWVIRKSVSGFTSQGLEGLDPGKSYLFISNHRDIVLDASLINYKLLEAGFPSTQIAFGDNLLINDFVSDLIRINKSFIVKRNKPPREQLHASLQLSRYIEKTLREGDSIWIAQREGRAKDGDDKTNPAVIKMFYLAHRKTADFGEFIRNCRIVPVAISYELDPCDRMKAWELYRKEKRDDIKKSKKHDLVSMWQGIKGPKGRVHIGFGSPLEGDYQNEKDVAADIDRAIHGAYRIWPSNLIAAEELGIDPGFAYPKPEPEEYAAFKDRLLKLPPDVRSYVLDAYARPVLNRRE